MYNFISILILIVCLLLVLIVLVQNSKGGGLASNFAETGQMMGVRKTADFLEKATWTLAAALVIFSLVATAALPHQEEVQAQSKIQEQVQRTSSGVMETNIPSSPSLEGEQPAATQDANTADSAAE